MGNLGTEFLRKVSKSEEGLTRISRVDVAKTGGKEAMRLSHFMSQDVYIKDSHLMRQPQPKSLSLFQSVRKP